MSSQGSTSPQIVSTAMLGKLQRNGVERIQFYTMAFRYIYYLALKLN